MSFSTMELTGKALIENIDKLRKRIIYCFLFIGLGMIIILPFIDRIMNYLTKPVGNLVFISPYEAFFSKIELTLFCGILISLPVNICIVYSFIKDFLPKHSKRSLIFFFPVAILLFISGTMLCIFVMLPLGVKFFLGFSTADIKPAISVGKYISLVVAMSLAFGLVFELPLVVLILSKMGIVSHNMLSKSRKYVIVVVFIVAAILTPPDIVTQIIMALPMLLLFEISIWLCKIYGSDKNLKNSKSLLPIDKNMV